MSQPGDLLEQVDRLGSSPWSGIAFRHTAPGRDALSGAGALRFGGRWNPPDLVSTIYLAVPLEACIAEFLRMADGQARGAESFLPRDLHELNVVDLEVLDLCAPGARDAVGLDEDDIVETDRRACQEVGKIAHYLGMQGIRAPSATGTGVVIAIFEPQVKPNQLTLRGTRQLASYL